MVVVVILASGAALALKLYSYVVANPAVYRPVLETVQRQAAVLGTFAVAVFLLIEALERLRIPTAGVLGGLVPGAKSATPLLDLARGIPGGVPG